MAREAGAFAAETHEAFEKGGAGAMRLASAVVDACEQPSAFHLLYPDDAPIREKIEDVARRIYGGGNVFFYPEAERVIDDFERNGLGRLPICRSPYS
jgi:formate--tetrahydrofolate ligase